MLKPSSRHLSHDFPAWKGLSLRELFWIVVSSTPITAIFFAISGIWFGYPLVMGCIGFLVGFILAITVIPKLVAKLKSGKPHGYLKKKMLLSLAKIGLLQSPWCHYQGIWRKSRTVGENNV